MIPTYSLSHTHLHIHTLTQTYTHTHTHLHKHARARAHTHTHDTHVFAQVTIEPDFEIRPYYAGHVLGAAMFYIRVGQQSLLYTGDYNMTPDRHLGSAR